MKILFTWMTLLASVVCGLGYGGNTGSYGTIGSLPVTYDANGNPIVTGNGSGLTNLLSQSKNYSATINLRASLARARNGQGSALIAWLGDSTAAGYGAAGNGYYNNAKAMSAPAQFSRFFSNGAWDGLQGCNQSMVLPIQYDQNQLQFGAFTIAAVPTAGQALWQGTVNNTTPFIISFPYAIDTVLLRTVNNLNGSGWVVADATNLLGCFTNSGATGVMITNQYFSVPLGFHKIYVIETNTTGNPVFMSGLEGFQASNSVRVLNCGWDASTACYWTNAFNGAPYDPLPTAKQLNANCYIVDLGINDLNNGVSLAQFTNALTDIALTLKTPTNDVVFCIPTPVSGLSWSTFGPAIYQVAANYGCAVVDLNYIMGGNWGAANSAGLMYNTVHPGAYGYSAMAEGVYEWLMLATPTFQAQTFTGTFNGILAPSAVTLNQYSAATFPWSQVPLFSGTVTNFYFGPWTNGTTVEIWSNTASSYVIKQIAP